MPLVLAKTGRIIGSPSSLNMPQVGQSQLSAAMVSSGQERLNCATPFMITAFDEEEEEEEQLEGALVLCERGILHGSEECLPCMFCRAIQVSSTKFATTCTSTPQKAISQT
jgi:hypothetical protein